MALITANLFVHPPPNAPGVGNAPDASHWKPKRGPCRGRTISSKLFSPQITPPRKSHPAGLLVIQYIVGLVGNIISMLVLSSGRGRAPRIRAAFAGALGSVAVIMSAVIEQSGPGSVASQAC